jgi:Tfp pilus assembly protein PilN
MLRTNLSTRPFYNIRAVQVALGAFGAVVVVMTLFNAYKVVTLATSQRSLGASAVKAQTEAARLRSEAAGIRARVDARELEVVSAAAKEANAIIDMRAFSWSGLLSQFEATLPESVRITAVQPRLGRDARFVVGIRVEARRTEDLEKFLDALETTGSFHDVLATDEQATDDGVIEAIVEAVYEQPARDVPAGNPEPAARRTGAAGD